MKPFELLGRLGAFSRLTPEEVLAHPAWSLPVAWGGGVATLRADGLVPAEAVLLKVRLGRGDGVLALSPNPAMPDFSRLFPVRGEVPDALMLAVIEREAGDVFQVVENATRQELAVTGMAGEGESLPSSFRAFRIVTGGDAIPFGLTLPTETVADFGDLRYLDASHESIAGMSMPVEIEAAVFALEQGELDSLAQGDMLLLPELSSGAMEGRVTLAELADATRCRVVAAGREEMPLGDWMAGGGALTRSFSEGDQLELVLAGRRLAAGRLSRLGGQRAFALETIG